MHCCPRSRANMHCRTGRVLGFYDSLVASLVVATTTTTTTTTLNVQQHVNNNNKKEKERRAERASEAELGTSIVAHAIATYVRRSTPCGRAQRDYNNDVRGRGYIISTAADVISDQIPRSIDSSSDPVPTSLAPRA